MIQNDQSRKGQLAGEREFFGEFGRYAVAPVHTRFEDVCWFVWDADRPDEDGRPSIVRQEPTREAALAGLDILSRGDERKLAQLVVAALVRSLGLLDGKGVRS